jgi:hypothetical protein
MREAIEVMLGCVGLVGWALLPWFWLRGVYAMFKAAANRAPGCGYLEAINGLSLLFNASNYSDVGVRWVRIYRRCLLGFLLVFPAEFLLSFLSRQLQP